MRNEKGQQQFGMKGFCDRCGLYSRSKLTRADYTDEFGHQRRGALLCADCFSELTGPVGDAEKDEGYRDDTSITTEDA